MRGEHPGHGTDWGYQWEWRHGHVVCDECREAHRLYMKNYRAKQAETARLLGLSNKKNFSLAIHTRIPVQMFRDMYLAVDPATALAVDDELGTDKVDKLIRRADELDERDADAKQNQSKVSSPSSRLL